MMRAVVLAAGDGGRLGARTASLPKPLVRIGGRPLIAFTFEALMAAGVREAVVVTGYEEAMLRAALGGSPGVVVPPALRIDFVSNPHYHRGASLSLRAARGATGADPFLLVMADHLLSAPLVAALVGAFEERTAHPGAIPAIVAADFHPRDPVYAEEATKLTVAPGGRVTAIGKHLATWQALDAGAFVCGPSTWEAVDAVAEDCELSAIFGEASRRGQLYAADVSGCFWYDVDTPADLAAAELLLRPHPGAAGARVGSGQGA